MWSSFRAYRRAVCRGIGPTCRCPLLGKWTARRSGCECKSGAMSASLWPRTIGRSRRGPRAGSGLDRIVPGASTALQRGRKSLCVDGGGDEGLDLVASNGDITRLVVIEGRERGFHDYQATIRDPFFVDGCRYVAFVFDGKVWLAETASGKIGQLAVGSLAWPIARAPSPSAVERSASAEER